MTWTSHRSNYVLSWHVIVLLLDVFNTARVASSNERHVKCSLTDLVSHSTHTLLHATTNIHINSIVISSSEMLKPHWLKMSQVIAIINTYCFFYIPTSAILM